MAEVLATVPTLRGGQTERPDSRPMTAFEAKGTAAGRAVADLTYRRVAVE